ncbi:prolipoprotein diacylglyceryl transferase, partial [Gammaproteobacteria bacterium]|nr:prolipoprotein diacylglyceryl transferase [Gammaproteobacteria bacterium]
LDDPSDVEDLLENFKENKKPIDYKRTDPYGLLRHPSQLYESLGEGIILFGLLVYVNKISTSHGVVCSFFLIFYGLIRFIIEFFRQPDAHIGYVISNFLSMGQILCIPMIVIGFIILFYSRKET